MAPAKPSKHYLLKVYLKNAKRVWRTIALRGDHTLEDLHEGIFTAFDRYDPHLYAFYFPKAPSRGRRSGPQPKEYTAPLMFDNPVPFGDDDQNNAAETRLDDLGLRAGQRFEYLFDFGDSWLHEVVVEKTSPVTPELRYGVIEKKGASPAQYGDIDT